MSNVIRVFLANAKGDSAEEMAEMKKTTMRILEREWPGCQIVVISGHEDFEANFNTARRQSAKGGGWEAWEKDVVYGVIPTTGMPRYHVCVCPHLYVGKATMQIVDGFVTARKPVYRLEKETMTPVLGCTLSRNNDFKTGWQLVLASQPKEQ